MHYIKIKNLLMLIPLFILSTTVAQERERPYVGGPLLPGVQELYVGDAMPDILIDKVINNDKRSFRTSDYKDGLLILDFWDIYCSSCIASMPKLDSLQRMFGDKAKILSVTWMPEKDIVKFFANNKMLKSKKVHRASVVEDDILRSHFPQRSVPHLVWIYKGDVVAITGYEYMTAENIHEVLDGKAIKWQLKDDNFDPRGSSLLQNNDAVGAMESPFYSHTVLTGQTQSSDKPGGMNFKQDTLANRTSVAFYNSDIFGVYQVLLFATKPQVISESVAQGVAEVPYLPHPSRKIFEVNDPSRLEYRPEYGNAPDWNAKNLVTYEFVKQGMVDQATMAKLVLADFGNRLGLEGRYEKRMVDCLVFVRTDKPITDTLTTAGPDGAPIGGIAMMQLDLTRKYPPAVNETGLGFKTLLRMEPTDGTLEGLKKEIRRHGLDLIEAKR